MKYLSRKWGWLLLGGLGIVVAGWWIAGSYLIAPSRQKVASLPSDLPGEKVRFRSLSGAQLAGWYIPGEKPATVVMMHGVRGNRSQMIERARFLHQAGYSTLLFDFQAHGESSGEHITYGHLESLDAVSAAEYARVRKPGDKVVFLGSSLGGAAAVLAQSQAKADALIVEMTFSTIERATANRLDVYLGRWGHYLTPLLTCQLPLRLHISTDALRPIDQIASIRQPKLIIAGAEDKLTTLDESKAFFNAASSPKELWIINGGGHIDLYQHRPKEYETKVIQFLGQSLGK